MKNYTFDTISFMPLRQSSVKLLYKNIQIYIYIKNRI